MVGYSAVPVERVPEVLHCRGVGGGLGVRELSFPLA